MELFPQNPAEPAASPEPETAEEMTGMQDAADIQETAGRPDADDAQEPAADAAEGGSLPDTPEEPEAEGIGDAPGTDDTACIPDTSDSQHTEQDTDSTPAAKNDVERLIERETALPAFDRATEFAALLGDRLPNEQEPDDSEESQRHIGLRVIAAFFAVLVLSFAVFCIVWDLKKGTSAGGYRAGDSIHVEIVQQAHPAADAAEADASGRYTAEGIAEKVMPSIVQIYTYSEGTLVGSGSGIILSADGYIATNAHVVSDADVFGVRFFNGRDNKDNKQEDAVLIGHDSKTDLAVIKVSVSGLTPAVFGNSDEMKLGEAVCALGNPAGLSGSITTGIISGINRKVRASNKEFEMDCLQTDAAISPGNSGGALVNMYGQVIGITSSKYASSDLFGGSTYEGLGFAISVNEALPILKELTEKGYVSGRVRIGITFLENDKALEELRRQAEEEEKTFTAPKELEGVGVHVLSVNEDSDLKNTIFEEGDWILTVNGQDVSDYDSICTAIRGYQGGDRIHCRCGRIQEDGTLKTYEIDFLLLEDRSGDY